MGAVSVFLIVTVGSRRSPRLHATVLRLVNGQAPTVALSQEAVRDVEQNDPGLAAVIESAPAVPVASVPEEVGQPAQQARLAYKFKALA